MRIRDRLGIDDRRQRQLTWGMEVLVIGVLCLGLWGRETGVIVNAGVALGIIQLVPILERDYGVPLDAGVTLWITSAVSLHALGTIGLPPGSVSVYRSVWWWDHLTHALSSSVVAGVGYATVRAIDEHSAHTHLPSKFVFVFLLLFVLAYGVVWEILEFGLALAASALGTDTVLTQYGLGDTMMDLLFNTIGAVIVGLWGTAHLNDLSGYLGQRFDRSGL